MNRIRFFLFAVLALCPVVRGATSTTPDLTVPSALNFTYQIGGTIPASQTLTIKSTTSAVLAYSLVLTQPTACTAPCVNLSATSGNTPGNILVYANPTGLAAGLYTATILVTGGANTHTVSVTLNVGNQASSLTSSTNTVALSYTPGSSSNVLTQPVTISSNGDALAASVTVAGGTWLKATPSGSVTLVGLPRTLTITADPTGLAPSATPYKATVTVASTSALNKSVVINVTFAVSAGVPSIAATNGIWPPGAPAGSTTPVTVTITGTNFTSSSTAASGSTPLTKITVISSTTMLATIPTSLLATTATLPIVVTTPTAASPSLPANFTVFDPNTPQIWAVTNSGSYNQGVVSPGEIITIYGAGLGAAGINTYTGATLPTSLSNTSVTIDGKQAPLLYTSPTQVSCVVPLAVAPGTASGPSVNVVVTYNGVPSAKPQTVMVVATDPGVFTVGSSGQAAVLNINTTVVPTDYSVNSTTNPTHPGSWIAIYATGFGTTTCTDGVTTCPATPPTEAEFVAGGVVSPSAPVTVTIGGQAVSVVNASVPVGSVIGLLQINAQVPASVAAGNAVPIVVTVGSASSVGVANIAVK